MVGRSRRFALSDTAQQVVGGFLLAGPFVVTEEVWVLAEGMSTAQAVLTVAIVLAIGYGTLYKADDRDPETERSVAGVPVRFVSLVIVSYLSVFVLAVAFDAPGTFLGEPPDAQAVLGVSMPTLAVTLKASSVGAVFSIIGAATADTLF